MVRISRALPVLFGLLAALRPAPAFPEAERDRFSAGGYFRVMTRPDFQGGDPRLGFWNLYGRLLNEGPYAALELRLDVLQRPPGRPEPWAAIQAKLEGGSFANADPGQGRLDNFRLTQLFLRAGNILFEDVTWQLGTLESYFGDLGLYDFRPAQILGGMVGASGRYDNGRVELLLGGGDSGYALKGAEYNTVLNGGGSVRVRLVPGHLEVGVGGEVAYEPEVQGSRFAPYFTPGVRYEDFVRQEVVQRYLEENPGRENLFPRPVATASQSWKAVGYLGFGRLGPLRWNNLFINYLRRHPQGRYTETFGGRNYDIYLGQLTDDRYELNLGNELQLSLWPGKLDAAWGLLYGHHVDRDNTIAAGDDNRRFYSTVLRLQYYLTRTVHLLTESSLAQEVSLNGNLYREHVNSIFRGADGRPNDRGLEFGDTDTRNTWQLKAGVVLNPTGLGIYARPSIRLLYGLQYSNQHAAFGSGFVDSLDQFNQFVGPDQPLPPERHWHSLIALEAEGWF
jgi:hypothetical protein